MLTYIAKRHFKELSGRKEDWGRLRPILYTSIIGFVVGLLLIVYFYFYHIPNFTGILDHIPKDRAPNINMVVFLMGVFNYLLWLIIFVMWSDNIIKENALILQRKASE